MGHKKGEEMILFLTILGLKLAVFTSFCGIFLLGLKILFGGVGLYCYRPINMILDFVLLAFCTAIFLATAIILLPLIR